MKQTPWTVNKKLNTIGPVQMVEGFAKLESSQKKVQELQFKISTMESTGGQLGLTGGSLAGPSQDAIAQVRREATVETSRLKEAILTNQSAHQQELLRLKQRHDQEVCALKAEHGKVSFC